MNGAVSSMNPDELVGERRHFDADGAGELAARHQEDRQLRVALAHRAQQVGRFLVRAAVVAALGPVEQDAMDAGVGCCQSVLARQSLADLNAASAQLLRERLHTADGHAGSVGEIAVDDEHLAYERAGFSALLHGSTSDCDCGRSGNTGTAAARVRSTTA